MLKVVVTENSKDAALISSGRALVVTQTGYSTQRIETSVDQRKYNIEFIGSEIKQDEELQYEVAIIKVKPATTMSNFFSSVRADFSSGLNTNHYFKMPKMVDLGATHTEEYSTAKSQASYSFETVFNYISEEYDKLQVGISEHNLYAPFDKASKQDFLNVRDRNTEIINFGRGNQMKNFVVPTMKVQQGSGESPYYNYLRINQRLDNGISHFAVKLGIFDELLQDYLFGDRTNTPFDIQQGQEVSQDLSVPIYNLRSFLTTDNKLDLDNFFTLKESVRPSRMSLDLRKHLMKGFLKDASKSGFRTYEDIYNNIESHKEVFCYSVDKHNGVALDSTKIQTLYAPALNESTPVIDTQVKYGKYYTYKVTGHYMVVGNTYEYRQIGRSFPLEGEHVTFQVTNRPSVVIIPFHIFSKQINVVQMPPVFPQVSFKTENDSSSTISMYLSPTKAEMKSPFIQITREDADQLLQLDRLPNARDLLGNFRFKTYGDQGLFEVFRLDHAPKSFSDFKDAKIAEISMPFKTMAAVFKDVVIPNKKYYYLFRSINQKSMVSNPTMVYETTLLVDADDSKIITNTYHFPKPRDMESALGFRKLLRITPAVEHVLFDDAQAELFGKTTLVGTLDNLKLGIRDQSVWGRKFKIRIKSKTSGKMIDIILNVDLTKNKTEEEF
jgi:hypothetical protein